MNGSKTVLIAVGGELSEAADVLDVFLGLVNQKSDARIVVPTIAAQAPETAGRKYNNLFRKKGNGRILFGIDIHVLPAGYRHDLKKRLPISPPPGEPAGRSDEE